MTGQAVRKPRRKPFTREQLLPLPAARIRALPLEHHLVLVALRAGHGSGEQVGVLIKVVYLADFMADARRDPVDPALLRAAEAALHGCGLRAHQEANRTLSAEDHAVLTLVLVLHDDQLGALPVHRYEEAWVRIHAFVKSLVQSPLPEPANV